MTYKCQSIVLHKMLWKESSFIVSLMTNNFGVISAIVQGVRKSKSPFFSQFEIGNCLEIVIYRKATTGLYKVIDSSVVFSTQNNIITYPNLLSLQISLEMYSQLVLPDDESKVYFELLLSFLQYLPKVKNNHLLINWRFLIKLSEYLGFPIVYISNDKYELSDPNEINKIYDDEYLKIIYFWLDKVLSANHYVQSDNILDPSCKVMNQFIYEWFHMHLNHKLHKKAMELYEGLVDSLEFRVFKEIK